MRRFNKQNCTSSVRAQITDKWGKNHYINGHHRLLAIIESGVTIEVLVVRGVAAWYTYDQGKSRSGGDIFQIAGVTNPFATKAIVAKCEAINEKKILHSRLNIQVNRMLNFLEFTESMRSCSEMHYQCIKPTSGNCCLQPILVELLHS